MTDDRESIERVAGNLRKTRQAKQLTQAEVAKRAGISETYYAQIERGEKNPATSIFLSIIEALDVPSADILGK